MLPLKPVIPGRPFLGREYVCLQASEGQIDSNIFGHQIGPDDPCKLANWVLPPDKTQRAGTSARADTSWPVSMQQQQLTPAEKRCRTIYRPKHHPRSLNYTPPSAHDSDEARDGPRKIACPARKPHQWSVLPPSHQPPQNPPGRQHRQAQLNTNAPPTTHTPSGSTPYDPHSIRQPTMLSGSNSITTDASGCCTTSRGAGTGGSTARNAQPSLPRPNCKLRTAPTLAACPMLKHSFICRHLHSHA